MLFLQVVSAVVLNENGTGKYLGSLNDSIELVDSINSASNFSLQPTQPPSIISILSLGTKALAVNPKNELVTEKLNRASNEQFFKLVLISDGTYVLQHNEGCIGALPGSTRLGVIDCSNTQSLLQLNKGDPAVPNNIVGYDTQDPLLAQPDIVTNPDIINRQLPPENVGFGNSPYEPIHFE